jgi:hypothetical protein
MISKLAWIWVSIVGACVTVPLDELDPLEMGPVASHAAADWLAESVGYHPDPPDLAWFTGSCVLELQGCPESAYLAFPGFDPVIYIAAESDWTERICHEMIHTMFDQFFNYTDHEHRSSLFDQTDDCALAIHEDLMVFTFRE